MLTSMVAGPGPAYYNSENGGRNGHQILDAVPPQIAPPSPPTQSVAVSNTATSTPSLNSQSSVASTTPTSSPNGNGNMVAVSPVDVCPSGNHYTPPPMSLAQPQGPPPPYCPAEFYPGDPYYPGPPPEFNNCAHHHPMCAAAINGVSAGPATVRMISTNTTPPIPLPVQMPPGHVVQQIVDETGTLQHVIVSTTPMALPGLCPYGPSANQGHPQFYNPPPPPGPHQGYIAPYPTGPGYSPVMSPPLTQHSPPPHNYPKPERNPRPFDKSRNKYFPRHAHIPSQQHNYQSSSNSTSNQHQKQSNIHSTASLSPKKDIQLRKIGAEEEMVNGDGAHQSQQYLIGILSQIKTPDVSGVTAYSAHLEWKPPDLSSCTIDGFSASDLRYEVFLNNNLLASPSGTQWTLNNLRPGTEYKYYLVCTCNNVRGSPTPAKNFCTKATKPDTPQPPRLVEKSKNSFIFRWSPSLDNGSRITNYVLKIIGGHYTDWREIHCQRNKQANITKLKPQTTYRIRLAAINDIGQSDYSAEVTETTNGLAPPPPLPPNLEDATVDSLTLGWTKRPCDNTFTLQFEDSTTGYGFMNAFTGPELRFTCTSLQRNSDYKFRMCSHNMDGVSPFSSIVYYRTLPDKPCKPSSPTLKGKAHSEKVSVCWNPPKDHGGSPVTSYIVEINRDNGFEKVYYGSNLDCDLSGLSPGKSYQVRVRAESNGGLSDWSDIAMVATKPVNPGPCQPPTLFGKPKAASLQLKWAYPEFDGGAPITEFQVDMTSSDNERKPVYCGRDLDCTVAGLLPGRPYVFLLRATNKVGSGPWSEPFDAVSGAGPPESPRAPNLACKDPHIVLVDWNEPINNGARVEQHIVQLADLTCPNPESSESSSTCGDPDADLTFTAAYTGSAPSCEVRNLSPASTYGFRVCSLNNAGQSSWSPMSTVTTPASVPAPVAHISSETEATEIVLHWTEPPCHGDTILHYNIEVGDKTVTTPEPFLEYTIGDLLPETTYKVRIQAVNSVGPGPFCSVHRVTTGPLPPLPPCLELLKASYNSLRIRWGDGRNSDLLKYSLQMEFLNSHKTMEFYQVYGGTNQSFKVGKLEENTTYSFRICATNETGIGPYSPVTKFTTTKAPPIPLKAPRIEAGPEGTFCVEWCPVRCPGDDKIVYRMQMLQAGKDQDYALVYTGSETSHVLTDLESQTGYYVRVCGVRICTDGEVMAGVYSSPTLFNTPKAPVVEVDKTQEIKKKDRKIRWQTLSDHEKAFALVAIFSLFAFIAAYVLSPEVAMR